MDFKSLEWNETEASRVKSLDISDLNKEIVEARDSLMAVQRAGATGDHDEASLSLKAAAESGEFGDGVTEGQLKEAALAKAKWVENAMKVQIARSDADRITRATEVRLDNLPEFVPGSYVGSVHQKFPRNQLMNHFFELNGDVEGGQEKFKQMCDELNQRMHGKYEMSNVKGHDIFNAAANQTTTLVTRDDPRDPRDVVILHQPEFSISANLPVETIGPVGDTYTFMREKIESGHGLRTVAGKGETEASPDQTVKTEDVAVSVVKRTVSMGITEEQTADVPQALRFINRKMNRFMAEDYENQVINGNGTAPNMKGLLNQDNIQTLGKIAHGLTGAALATQYLEHALAAFEKLWDDSGTAGYGVGNTMPSFLAVRWAQMKQLMATRTTQGEYLWGDAISGKADRIWGVPIILAQWLPATTALTMNVDDVFVVRKQGLVMEWGISDDDFLRGQRRIRMVYRANVGVERPGSIVKIDYGVAAS